MTEADELRQKLADLTTENKSLREQVAQLQEQVKQLRSRPIVQPQPRQPLGSMPRNWVPREFDGMTYYLVPLESN